MLGSRKTLLAWNLALPEAIKVSCNAFFYHIGNAAGIDSIDRVGELLGLGKPSGSESDWGTAWSFAGSGLDTD